jgi:hypothetical protein
MLCNFFGLFLEFYCTFGMLHDGGLHRHEYWLHLLLHGIALVAGSIVVAGSFVFLECQSM